MKVSFDGPLNDALWHALQSHHRPVWLVVPSKVTSSVCSGMLTSIAASCAKTQLSCGSLALQLNIGGDKGRSALLCLGVRGYGADGGTAVWTVPTGDVEGGGGGGGCNAMGCCTC